MPTSPISKDASGTHRTSMSSPATSTHAGTSRSPTALIASAMSASLIGAQPESDHEERWRHPGEPCGEDYQQQQVDDALQSLDENLEHDLDLLGFSREVDE